MNSDDVEDTADIITKVHYYNIEHSPVCSQKTSNQHIFFSETIEKVNLIQYVEFLIQVYTLHMVLSRDENVRDRVISLLMSILTIPRGIISFEECIRKIDPSMTELGNSQYILLV